MNYEKMFKLLVCLLTTEYKRCAEEYDEFCTSGKPRALLARGGVNSCHTIINAFIDMSEHIDDYFEEDSYDLPEN